MMECFVINVTTALIMVVRRCQFIISTSCGQLVISWIFLGQIAHLYRNLHTWLNWVTVLHVHPAVPIGISNRLYGTAIAEYVKPFVLSIDFASAFVNTKYANGLDGRKTHDNDPQPYRDMFSENWVMLTAPLSTLLPVLFLYWFFGTGILNFASPWVIFYPFFCCLHYSHT